MTDRYMYIGFSVFRNFSKFIMYTFFINFWRKYQSSVNLLYTDTYSLLLEIFTENFYADMQNIQLSISCW